MFCLFNHVVVLIVTVDFPVSGFVIVPRDLVGLGLKTLHPNTVWSDLQPHRFENHILMVQLSKGQAIAVPRLPTVLKLDNSKSWNFVQILKSFWQNGIHLSSFNMVGLLEFRSHSKCGPFVNQPLYDCSKSIHVWITDPHCMSWKVRTLSGGLLKVALSYILSP